jgi:mannose-6-phosphate isomerase-like protein (cupin superfamily)
MKLLPILLVLMAGLRAQAPDQALVIDLDHVKWQHDSDDPPGGESAILRMDRQTGAMEFLARYPGGFAFKPHSHQANERFILFRGQASIEVDGKKTLFGESGIAYFPKGQVHKITCTSKGPCTWYLNWDGKP